MRYRFPVGKGFQLSSGRVIAIGRLILATLFLFAIWLDASQPARAPAATYALLTGYIAWSAAIVALTWRNWWLDAQLAGYAHAVDILLFTVLVLLTDGYTSPFFTFFMFVLLAAAIRWDWHATAFTAMLLTLLYVIVGLVVLRAGVPFEPQRFVVRTGHLIILSLVLIWFGANQRWMRIRLIDDDQLAQPSLDESPIETSLRAAMKSVGAATGRFLWREQGKDDLSGLAIGTGGLTMIDLSGKQATPLLEATPFLYDFRKNRGLTKDSDRNLKLLAPTDLVAAKAAAALQLNEGLAIPVKSDGGQGLLMLEQISGLSTDHIDLGGQIAAEVATHLRRHRLQRSADESAEARSRLTLARDLHDSVVQFLAGASFRLEAMKRSSASGRDVEPELDELKRLMMQEQRELRTFITSLRSGPLSAFSDVARDLQGLAVRLSRQWDISCQFSAEESELMIPTRLRFDAQQLVREAVANAVRHASAKSVTVALAAASDQIRLQVVNDGAAFPRRGGKIEMPASLRERVEQAGGNIDVARGMGVTKLSISLPIGEVTR